MTAKSRFEVKLAGVKSLGEREFVGHGSTFGNVDLGGDRVQRGAFRKSLDAHRKAGTWPLMAWQHDMTRIPGKWIDIREDDRGLAVHGVLADTPLGNEVRELLKLEAVGGLSIGYRVTDSDFDANGVRVLKAVDLIEVSVVSLPMNPAATVATVKRSELAAGIQSVRDYEQMVRHVYGLSRGAAKRLASKTWPAFAEAVGADADETELSMFSDELSQATAIALLRGAASKIRSL